jgi:hypothetical protein
MDFLPLGIHEKKMILPRLLVNGKDLKFVSQNLSNQNILVRSDFLSVSYYYLILGLDENYFFFVSDLIVGGE